MPAKKGFYHHSRKTMSLRGIWLRLKNEVPTATLRRQPNHMTLAHPSSKECPQCSQKGRLTNIELLTNSQSDGIRAYTAQSCESCLNSFENDMQKRTQDKMAAYEEGWEVNCDSCDMPCTTPSVVHSTSDNLQLVACTMCFERRKR